MLRRSAPCAMHHNIRGAFPSVWKVGFETGRAPVMAAGKFK